MLVDLQGVKSVDEDARIEVMPDMPGDASTAAAEEKSRRMETANLPGPQFVHDVPAYSITVMRVKAQR